MIDAVEWQTRGPLSISGLEPWIEAGLPPSALLKAMTTDAARLLDVDKYRGELRVGLAADIIATVENPLENANALKRVSFVMKDGVVIKTAE